MPGSGNKDSGLPKLLSDELLPKSLNPNAESNKPSHEKL